MLLENLKETIHTEVHYETRPGVGHSVEFTDELFDSDGNLIGTTKGISVVFSDPSDQRMMQLVSAVDTFPDGRVAWTGKYDMLPAEDEHRVPAYGISGRYVGMSGTRAWRMVERPDEETTVCVSSLHLDANADVPAAVAAD
jgi:Allene oxide cyclase barrel like domain